MKKEVARFCKHSAFSVTVSGVCSLALLGLLVGILGTTFGQVLMQTQRHLIYYPSIGMFVTLFCYGLLTVKRNIYTWIVSLAAIASMLYITWSIEGVIMILPGIAIGLTTARFCTVPGIKKAYK